MGPLTFVLLSAWHSGTKRLLIGSGKGLQEISLLPVIPIYIYIHMVSCRLFTWGMEFKFLADPRGYLTHIRQGFHTGTKAEISLSRCQWSYPKGHGHIGPEQNYNKTCRLTFDISRALVGHKIVDHSDVIGASLPALLQLHLHSRLCT